LADLYLFKKLAALDETSALEQATALYRGFLLEGCDEHWVYQERVTTEMLYLAAMETLAKRYHDASRYDDAVGVLRIVISTDPLRETARRYLMRAYAAAGNLSNAVLAYREFRELVRREVNSVPDAETTQLYQEIRANVDRKVPAVQERLVRRELPLSSPTIGRLPRPISALVGRNREIIEIDKALGSSRLVTLIGSGGIGKTRLALQTAETTLEQFTDGAWFADLSGIKVPEVLASFVASTLEIPEDAAESPRERLTQFLKQKEILLVLDNCEHIVSACAELAQDLLNSCPLLRILATSREALGINGEYRWAVPALAIPGALGEAAAVWDPQELIAIDSVRLFVERGRALQPDFTLNPANTASIVEICNRLDGIPLSIELAAARLCVLSPEQIAKRLKDRFRLLTGGSRTAWPRHQTLLGMIEWSHDLLCDAEKTLFRRLAIFSGGWTIDDLACVGGEDQTELLDTFTFLIEKSLVQADAAVNGERRYRMLESIREFALSKLDAAGELTTISRLHASYFLTVALAANDGIVTIERETFIRQLVMEYDNMRSALEWTINTPGEAETAARLAMSLIRFWFLQCLYREALRWLERVLALDDEIDPAVLCKLNNGVGSMYWVMGHFDSAQVYYERHLALSRELDDLMGVGSALMNLGLVAMHRGEYPLARSRMEESITLIRKYGDRNILATPLSNLAIVAKDMGELDYAFRLLEESYGLNKELNNRRGMAATLILRGNLERRLSTPQIAKDSFHEAMALARDPSDRQTCAIALHNLGDITMKEGDLSKAREYFVECLSISNEVTDRRQIATTLCSLGQLNRTEGNLAEYRAMYRQGADLAIEMQDRVLILTMLTDLAEQANISGKVDYIPRIAGVIEAAHEQYGTPIHDMQKEILARLTAAARMQLGDDSYCATYKEGLSISLDIALNAALLI
jgi:predicted ATPase/predicted negative regulator of RcsB-dependent stress response